MATAKTGTISSPDRKIRAMPTPRPQATTMAPARCSATKTTSNADLVPEKLILKTFAPNSSRKAWNVTHAPCCSWLRSVSAFTGDCWYPPRAAISRGANCPAMPAAAAAPARASSYRQAAFRFPRLISPCTTRSTQASASGTMQVSNTIESPTIITASARPTSTGTYQRFGARSISSQIASSGTAVPVWSGESSRIEVTLS